MEYMWEVDVNLSCKRLLRSVASLENVVHQPVKVAVTIGESPG